MLAIGTRVFLTNYSTHDHKVKGVVIGHGVQHRITYAQEVVLVQLDKGAHMEGYPNLFVSTLAADPSNVVVLRKGE